MADVADPPAILVDEVGVVVVVTGVGVVVLAGVEEDLGRYRLPSGLHRHSPGMAAIAARW